MKKAVIYILLVLCLALPACGKSVVVNSLVIAGSNSVWSSAKQRPESVKIISQEGKDLTPVHAWPTIHVGESLTVFAYAYPADLQNPVVKWDCSDWWEKSLKLKQNDDGSATITCISTELMSSTLTLNVNGENAWINVYIKEAPPGASYNSDNTVSPPERFWAFIFRFALCSSRA